MVIERIRKYNPLIDQWNRKDWFYFFILVPTALFLIFCLPNSIRQYFILDFQNPTLFSIFANHYAHTELNHLGNNLGMYLLVMYTIFNIETDKRQFYRVMKSLFLVMPFVSSFLMIRYLSSLPPLQGFSAIGSGLVGYILYAVYSIMKSNFDFVKPFLFSLLLMINFLTLSILNNYGIELVVIIWAVILILLAINFRDIITLGKEGIASFNRIPKGIHFEFIYKACIFAFSIVLAFALPFIIPTIIVHDGTITNTLGHYVGWVWGFSIPWLLIGISVIFCHYKKNE